MRYDTTSQEKTYIANAMVLEAIQHRDIIVPTSGESAIYVVDTASYAKIIIAADGCWHTNRSRSYGAYSSSAIFQQLVDSWHVERGASSSITQIAICRSYQRIIAMGRDIALPLIMQDLLRHEDDPDHWFWALQALTGEDPVPVEARGDMRQMAQAWLDWGLRNGYAY